jgi:DNA-binding PadR family transcriptional regulator
MKGDRLGEFEELTLLAILGLDNDAYGVTVQERLERESRREISLGAVYAALDRLERKGYLHSALGDVIGERGGKRRRLFTVTAAGIDAVRDARRTRDALWNGVPRALRGRS